jgi:sulfate adenylyltransferase subunit 1 (EFTu-like GTPase family)
VTSIEKFLAPGVRAAGVGESIGITIADALPVERGELACAREARARVTTEVQAKVFWMSVVPLGAGERLVLRLATQEVPARVAETLARVDAATLEVVDDGAPSVELANGEVAEVTVRTERPIACELFRDVAELGRFVFARDGDIVAGGIITLA